MEQKESIDPDLLLEISKSLNVPVEAIKNFNDEHAVNIISNTFNEGSFLNTGDTPTFNVNPLDKHIQLHEEKIDLYERMLKEKDEEIGEVARGEIGLNVQWDFSRKNRAGSQRGIYSLA